MSRFSILLAISLSVSAAAQTPYLVTDINTTRSSPAVGSSPFPFVVDGNTVYFSASTPDTGNELWKSVNGQAELVKDIYPGSPNAYPTELMSIGGGVFLFTAIADYTGRDLWRTDGTSAGTWRVKDLSAAGAPFLASGGKVYFPANDGVHGTELWVSDGTEAGTQMVLDFNGDPTYSGPVDMKPLGNRFIVVTTRAGVWSTDGTAGGTTQINSVANSPTWMIAGNGKLFFGAWDADHGFEPWVTDGTVAGTYRIADVRPGTSSSLEQFNLQMAPVGDGVVFLANDGVHGFALWKTNGTEAGTTLVKEIISPQCTSPVCHPPRMAASQGLVFITSYGLWRTDGTTNGTFLVDTSPSAATPVDAFSRLYYFRDGTSASSLASSDGTIAGTTTVATLPGANLSVWPSAVFTGGKLFFNHDSPIYGNEPWVCEDGTAATTHLLANVAPDGPPSSAPDLLIAAGDLVFFTASNGTTTDFWRSDGTAAGTIELTDSSVTDLKVYQWTNLTGNGGAFYASDANHALWRSDGTPAGTHPFEALTVNSLFGGSRLLYLKEKLTSDLWRSDGTSAGTFQLKNGNPSIFGEIAGRVYFRTETPADILWRTEGTEATTQQLLSLSQVSSAVEWHGALFFAHDTSAYGTELWRTDGTFAGTALVKDVEPGDSSANPQKLTAAGNYLYVVFQRGVGIEELWRTDGTAAGTILLMMAHDQYPGSDFENLTAANGLLFFTINDGVHGAELWRSNGTPEGTVLVRDIVAGSASSSPSYLKAANGLLWFAADDGVHGTELWRSDGTDAGTLMVADLAAGTASSNPAQLTLAGPRLFFRATDSLGTELWAVEFANSAITIADARVVEGNSGTATLQFTVTRSGSVANAASVAFATSNLSATAGSDYAAQSGTVNFAAGETSKTIDVIVNGDTTIESNEMFEIVLSSPSGAMLLRDRATGIIENDDLRADLSVTLSPYWVVKITNAGPSPATNVQLRVTANPGTSSFIVQLSPIAAGETRSVTPQFPYVNGIGDSTRPAGLTVTVTATATEPDSNATDSTASGMYHDGSGAVLYPPFLRTGETAGARFTTSAKTASITSSSPSVISVTPAVIDDPNGVDATFTLQAGNSAGSSVMSSGVPHQQVGKSVLYVFGQGQTPKLDVYVGASTNIFHVEYQKPVEVPVRIIGIRPDDGHPTGTVRLLDANFQIVSQAQLDANSSAVLTRTGLQPGVYVQYIEYAGDAFFNPIRVRIGDADVHGWETTVTLDLTRRMCGMAEGTATVKTTSTANAPTGTIRLTLNSNFTTTLTLTPTGNPGESRAVIRVALPNPGNMISVAYLATGTFYGDSTSQTINAEDCTGFGTSFYIVTPCRVLDTRDSTSVAAGATRNAAVGGRCGIPATAKAVAMNVTVVAPTQTGWFAFAPGGLFPFPSTSTINYRANKTRANNTITPLPLDGTIDMKNGGGAAAHLIIDVTGYFQ